MNTQQFEQLAETYGFAPSRPLREMIDAAVAQARQHEREACAKAVEQAKVLQLIWYPEGYHVKANDIGSIYKHQHDLCLDAIRARGQV